MDVIFLNVDIMSLVFLSLKLYVHVINLQKNYLYVERFYSMLQTYMILGSNVRCNPRGIYGVVIRV